MGFYMSDSEVFLVNYCTSGHDSWGIRAGCFSAVHGFNVFLTFCWAGLGGWPFDFTVWGGSAGLVPDFALTDLFAPPPLIMSTRTKIAEQYLSRHAWPRPAES